MEEFIRELIEILRKKLDETGEQYLLDMSVVCKNNDRKLHGVVIRKPEEQISKTIYIEPLIGNNYSVTNPYTLADEIILLNEETSYETQLKESIIDYNDYNNVQRNIITRVISKELNEEFLEDKVYVDIKGTDLVAVLYVLIMQNDEGIASFAVSKDMMLKWNVNSIEELYTLALENTRRTFPPMFSNMGNFLTNSGMDIDEDTSEMFEKMLHILSNKHNINGSTSILFKDCFRDFALAHKVEEIIILPSSRHELILLPQNGDIEYKYCAHMVVEVNQNIVNDEDVLSNHIYIYNLTTDSFEMWEE